MKIVGTVLLILGIIGVVVFGIQAFNDSESFNVLGAEVAVSKANWTPLIVSALVLLAGIVLQMTTRKSD
ncbi:transglycosylase [uncultured Sunxiuqinia sp.]|uniref:transglycosylase n=1 Tax=uncultured Sunxiuqinia sp. TaxID=1573825 RepID=UPI002AA84D77|nr:transglycosylase [uncultured Sunxiuqinia sp.]